MLKVETQHNTRDSPNKFISGSDLENFTIPRLVFKMLQLTHHSL